MAIPIKCPPDSTPINPVNVLNPVNSVNASPKALPIANDPQITDSAQPLKIFLYKTKQPTLREESGLI